MPALTFLVKSICLKNITAVGHMVFHKVGGGKTYHQQAQTDPDAFLSRLAENILFRRVKISYDWPVSILKKVKF